MRSVLLVVVASLVPTVAYADEDVPPPVEAPKPDAPLMQPTPTPLMQPTPCPKAATAPARYVLDDRAPAARSHAKWFAIGGGLLWIASAWYAHGVQQDYNAFAIERDVAKSRLMTASVMFVGGTAALATSAYLYFVLGKKQPAVAPVIGRDHVGVALARTF